jgi:hypothetical protein
MYRYATRAVIVLLALPTYAVVYVWKAAHSMWRSRFALTLSLRCNGCHEEISLVGTWRCRSDGFTYSGHLLRSCPICHTRPTFVRCLSCGLTKKIL